MNSTFVPTLQDITVKRIALLFYKDPKISRMTECEPFEDPTTEWNDLVNEKVSKLLLPAPLQRRLLAAASSDCLWLARCYALHHKYPLICGDHCQCLERILVNSYLQTSDGLFDEEKFFEDLSQDLRIDMAFRFILALEFAYVQTTVRFMEQNLLRMDDLWKQIDQDGRKCLERDGPKEVKSY
ncbi:hypothetical protein AVEN_195456-1, partial [Araneus ventricosus]